MIGSNGETEDELTKEIIGHTLRPRVDPLFAAAVEIVLQHENELIDHRIIKDDSDRARLVSAVLGALSQQLVCFINE